MPEEENEESKNFIVESLEVRILQLVSDIPMWTFKDLQRSLPNENEKTLYRTIKKLVEKGSIRELGWQGRSKRYTCFDVSNLPHIKNREGHSYDIGTVFSHIPNSYENGTWPPVAELNKLMADIGLLFIIANRDDEALGPEYRALIHKFVAYKETATYILDIIDAILTHPIMSGDAGLFKKLLTGKDAPDIVTRQRFQVWFTKLEKGELSNED